MTRNNDMSNGDDLWSGVNLKLQYAAFFLTRMQAPLDPPPRTTNNVVQESSGAILATNWQQAFYANFDAFLAMARSVPEIINCCFGEDRVLRDWFRTLPEDQQQRRTQFSKRFRDERDRFRDHDLTDERNNSLHRIGVPGATVAHTGLFGVQYVGTAVAPIPASETRPLPPGDPHPWLARPTPVRPHWSDFTIDGKPLFDECHNYLKLANELVEHARRIANEVHGSHSLTPPSLG
jgi:hypothetical protein